jgi:hypothetical protein
MAAQAATSFISAPNVMISLFSMFSTRPLFTFWMSKAREPLRPGMERLVYELLDTVGAALRYTSKPLPMYLRGQWILTVSFVIFR